MHPAVPIAIALVVIGALAKAKRPQVSFGLAGQVWAPPMGQAETVAYLDSNDRPYRIYDGRPELELPPGYELVPLAVTDENGTYYDPRRFVQFQATVPDPWDRDRAKERARKFQNLFELAWVEGGIFHRALVAKPAERWECPKQIRCFWEDEYFDADWGLLSYDAEYFFEGNYMRTEMGGSPKLWAERLGPGFSCNAASWMGECYDALPVPVLDHPLVKTQPPADLKGLTNG